jgi:dTDP-4-dehydrorhamnose 3,5-epimerase
MKVIKRYFGEVLLIKNDIYKDSRGLFFESFNLKNFKKILGKKIDFVQDNISISKQNVLRGLHYQIVKPQGKLIRVIKGEIIDVFVNIKKGSKYFGKHHKVILNNKNNYLLWIPKGYAHGFKSLKNDSIVMYKTDEFYYPNYDRCLYFNDKKLSINWPKNSKITISSKDKLGKNFSEIETL